jgi:Ulp1 family protease
MTPDARFEEVKKWLRKAQVFEKNYLFFPIHSPGHWSVVIACQPADIITKNRSLSTIGLQPGIYYLNPLGASPSERHKVVSILVDVLKCAWLDEARSTQEELLPSSQLLKGQTVQGPYQIDTKSCGPYLLHATRRFSIDFIIPAHTAIGDQDAGEGTIEVEGRGNLKTCPNPETAITQTWFTHSDAVNERHILGAAIRNFSETQSSAAASEKNSEKQANSELHSDTDCQEDEVKTSRDKLERLRCQVFESLGRFLNTQNCRTATQAQVTP